MSGFLASHAGLIELSLFELLAVAWAGWELWSVRRSLRRDRERAVADAERRSRDDARSGTDPPSGGAGTPDGMAAREPD